MPSEKFTVSGKDLVDKVKHLVNEGNVRLIHNGRPLVDIPLTIGASAATITVLAAPVLAAIGTIAALITECTLEVEKTKETRKDR